MRFTFLTSIAAAFGLAAAQAKGPEASKFGVATVEPEAVGVNDVSTLCLLVELAH